MKRGERFAGEDVRAAIDERTTFDDRTLVDMRQRQVRQDPPLDTVGHL
jgi:hypothetical protein